MGKNLDGAAWIGLRKLEDTCTDGTVSNPLQCRRKDWTWQDGTEYTYLAWQNWTESEPEVDELCARLKPLGGWGGAQCSHTYQYLCEKGKTITIYPTPVNNTLNQIPYLKNNISEPDIISTTTISTDTSAVTSARSTGTDAADSAITNTPDNLQSITMTTLAKQESTPHGNESSAYETCKYSHSMECKILTLASGMPRGGET